MKQFPTSFNQDSCLVYEYLQHARGVLPAPRLLASGLRLRRDVNLDILQSALKSLADRHESLRTGFADITRPDTALEDSLLALACSPAPASDTFRQTVQASVPPIPFSVRDLRTGQPGNRDEALQIIVDEQRAKHFVYNAPPLMRTLLVVDHAGDPCLIVILHHLIGDMRSLNLLRRDLEALYWAHANGTSPQLPDLPTQLGEFALAERRELQGERMNQLLSFWKRLWSEYGPSAALNLPFARIQRLSVHTISSEEELTVDADSTAALHSFARKKRVTIYVLFLAALSVVLHRHVRKERIGIWCCFANRTMPGIENAVGWFSHSHLLGITISPDAAVDALLAQILQVLLEASSHQAFPDSLLTRLVAPLPGRVSGREVSISTGYVDARESRTLERAPRLILGPASLPRIVEPNMLRLPLVETRDGLTLTALYSADVFERSAIAALLREWIETASALAAGGTRLDDVPARAASARP